VRKYGQNMYKSGKQGEAFWISYYNV